MRRSWLRLYGPFLALAIVQATLVAVAPSRAPDRSQVAAGVNGGPGGGFTSGPGGSGTNAEGAGVTTPGGGVVGGGGAGGGGGGGSTGNTITLPSGEVVPAGDTSHCVGDQQFDILLVNVRCMPRFAGPNGGATYPGVTEDEVLVVFFESEPNAAVNAVLAPQGLAATEAELAALDAAAQDFINANYELYGRQVRIVRVQGNCPTSPPNVPACKEAARRVTDMHPFLVLWATPLYAEVFDEWARAGIISIGGWHFDNNYFTQRRPYRYDVFMDGTQTAEHIAEYYCTKMANRPADHAGVSIHSTIGGRNTMRRLGIVTPNIDANVSTANHVAELVAACSDGADPVVRQYESRIETAQTQSTNTTLALINDKVTTVVCMCDPIAPVFQTQSFTQQNYYPEYLMAGLGLIDYDLLGRLYEPSQMQHAFGPSHLQVFLPFEQQDQSRMWRAAGREGSTCGSCGLPWAYHAFAAAILHYTGPNLTPSTVEQTMLNLGRLSNGDVPGTVGLGLGPNDYTLIDDVKEVYWCSSCPSAIDGRAGAYIPVNGGRRYRLGQWLAGLDQIPVAPA